MLTQITVIGAAALGCAAASREAGHNADRTMPRPSAPVALDGSMALLPRRAGDLLTAAELSAAPGLANASVYDAVLRLRPGFLQPRDARTGVIASRGVLPAVFVNGTYFGDVESLRMISVAAVAELQYVRTFDAVLWYGPDYAAGVLLVRLRRR